jgi:F0F1-type ATP synthase membrane subunit b/b'
MNEPIDWIEDAANAGIELRSLIKEAHEVLRDLKTTKKEVEQLSKQAAREVQLECTRVFESTFGKELTAYTDAIEQKATSAINRMSKLFGDEAEQALGKLMEASKEAIDNIVATKKMPPDPLSG